MQLLLVKTRKVKIIICLTNNRTLLRGDWPLFPDPYQRVAPCNKMSPNAGNRKCRNYRLIYCHLSCHRIKTNFDL